MLKTMSMMYVLLALTVATAHGALWLSNPRETENYDTGLPMVENPSEICLTCTDDCPLRCSWGRRNQYKQEVVNQKRAMMRLGKRSVMRLG